MANRNSPTHWFGRRGSIIALATGFGAGLGLWAFITAITGNVYLGLVFGLIPGVAVGVGLSLTGQK